jgi:tetratricopeptide (TPR) repeat protein
MLVVLDNAGSVEQARPLLPGSASCLTLITSRDALAGLVARDGAERISLDLLSPAEADRLLTRLVGERAAADPQATAGLAAACARLPLALRVAAELAASRPAAAMADLAAELADRQGRLDLLDAGGDPRTAVRAVFSWSYQHLEAATGHLFRVLGLHPGPDLEPYAAAALTGSTVAEARQRLDQLARAHLIRPAADGRYEQHDLLRTYARELANTIDGDDACRDALTRLFDHYLHSAAVAMKTLHPARQQRRPRIPAPATPIPPLTDPGTARAWLDGQRATLVAVAAYAADHGWPRHTTKLAPILSDYFVMEGHFPEGIAVHTCAVQAARSTGDRATEAVELNSLGAFYLWQGRYQEAGGILSQALVLHRESGDLRGQDATLNNLGLLNFQLGRDEEAAGQYREALALSRQASDESSMARTLNNLGLLEQRRGRYREATGYLREAVALSRRFENPMDEAFALANLGVVSTREGRYPQAEEHLQRALTLARQVGSPACEAFALSSLAAVDRRQSRYERAGDRDREALALCRRSGDQTGEAHALNGLGDLSLATARPGQARTRYASALRLARQIGDKAEEASAHDGLGHVWQALADPGKARRRWEQALAIYAGIGLPEADQVRAQLSALPAADASGDRPLRQSR